MKRGLGTIGEGVGIENTSQNSQNKNLDKWPIQSKLELYLCPTNNISCIVYLV